MLLAPGFINYFLFFYLFICFEVYLHRLTEEEDDGGEGSCAAPASSAKTK